MEESQRQNLVTAFNNVMRTSGLVGVVDLQRAAIGFSSLIDQVPDGSPIPLEPLYEFLLEQSGPEPAVNEVIVFLKSREERFGVTFELPAKLASLSEEETNKIIVAFTSRSVGAGTYGGKTADKAPPAPTTPTPAAPSRGKAKPSMPTQRKLALVLVVLVVLLVGNLVWNAMTAPPPPRPFALTDPAGLPCKESFISQGVVVCRVPAAFWKNPKSVIDAKGAVTKAAVKAQGLAKVYVYTLEDGKLLLVL